MKSKKLISLLIMIALCVTLTSPAFSKANADTVTLTVLNPKAHIETRPMTPLAERLDTLIGKKIGLFPYSKDTMGGVAWPTAMETLLNARFAGTGTTIITLTAKAAVGWHDSLGTYESGARALDAMIFGVQN